MTASPGRQACFNGQWLISHLGRAVFTSCKRSTMTSKSIDSRRDQDAVYIGKNAMNAIGNAQTPLPGSIPWSLSHKSAPLSTQPYGRCRDTGGSLNVPSGFYFIKSHVLRITEGPVLFQDSPAATPAEQTTGPSYSIVCLSLFATLSARPVSFLC